MGKRGRPRKSRPPAQPSSDQEAIGVRIRDQRELRGWSTVDLAQRAGLTGNAIRELEAGERAPRIWTIWLLARALGCSAGWLAFGG
jgi:transcriptional regulator with XRE-family HTH domain